MPSTSRLGSLPSNLSPENEHRFNVTLKKIEAIRALAGKKAAPISEFALWRKAHQEEEKREREEKEAEEAERERKRREQAVRDLAATHATLGETLAGPPSVEPPLDRPTTGISKRKKKLQNKKELDDQAILLAEEGNIFSACYAANESLVEHWIATKGWEVMLEVGPVGDCPLLVLFLVHSPAHIAIAKKCIDRWPVLVFARYQGKRILPDGTEKATNVYEGESALHLAVVNNNENLANFLLDAQQDCHNAGYCKNLDLMELPAFGTFFSPPLVKNPCYYGDLPLGFAACTGNQEMCTLLLERGADLFYEDRFGNTLLHILALHNLPDMILFILECEKKHYEKRKRQQEQEEENDNYDITDTENDNHNDHNDTKMMNDNKTEEGKHDKEKKEEETHDHQEEQKDGKPSKKKKDKKDKSKKKEKKEKKKKKKKEKKDKKNRYKNSNVPLRERRNHKGLTCLQVAAQAGKLEAMRVILESGKEVVWTYGLIQMVKLPLWEIDTVRHKDSLDENAKQADFDDEKSAGDRKSVV